MAQRHWKTHDLCDLFESFEKGYIPLACTQFTNQSLSDDPQIKIKRLAAWYPARMDWERDVPERRMVYGSKRKPKRGTTMNTPETTAPAAPAVKAKPLSLRLQAIAIIADAVEKNMALLDQRVGQKISEKEEALIKIFNTKEPFGCHTNKVLELVRAITGFKIKAMSANEPWTLTVLGNQHGIVPAGTVVLVPLDSENFIDANTVSNGTFGNTKISRPTKEQVDAYIDKMRNDSDFATNLYKAYRALYGANALLLHVEKLAEQM